MDESKKISKAIPLGVILIIAAIIFFIFPIIPMVSLINTLLMIFGFLLILFGVYSTTRARLREEDSQVFTKTFLTRRSLPFKRHDIIKSTNWHRKELNAKNWRILDDHTFVVSLSEPKFRDPHTIHVFIRHEFENIGYIIDRERDPTSSPLQQSVMKDVSYHINGGISAYIGKKPSSLLLFLGIIIMLSPLILLMFYWNLIVIIVLLIIGFILLLFGIFIYRSSDRNQIFALEEGTYYVEWEIFFSGDSKRVAKLPKKVTGEYIVTLGILPGRSYSDEVAKEGFRRIVNRLREIFQENNFEILEEITLDELF